MQYLRSAVQLVILIQKDGMKFVGQHLGRISIFIKKRGRRTPGFCLNERPKQKAQPERLCFLFW